jgi:hypothetical protein
MLRYGLRHRDLREIAGQMLRLTVAAPGSWTGRYPVGNTVALTSALYFRCPYPTIFDSFSKVPPPVVPVSRSRHRFKVVELAAGVQSHERASRPA